MTCEICQVTYAACIAIGLRHMIYGRWLVTHDMWQVACDT